jgi:hypothetical protein
VAAGLPIVVSDCDGYKDTGRDGVDRFHIPALTLGRRLGSDLAWRRLLRLGILKLASVAPGFKPVAALQAPLGVPP